jgi:SAM-dependent methyltransferase
VLETGFGHGSIRSQLPAGTRYIGVDREPQIVAHARERFPGDEFVEADIAASGFAERFAGREIDTVMCFNLLEHVADDRSAVVNLLSVLRPGGNLMLFVPAFRALFNDLDRLAGHHRRYTRQQLLELVPSQLGVVRRNKYFNPIGAAGWWLNGLLKHDSLEATAVKGQVRLFESFVLPLSRALDPLTRGVFGQSIVCLVERR